VVNIYRILLTAGSYKIDINALHFIEFVVRSDALIAGQSSSGGDEFINITSFRGF